MDNMYLIVALIVGLFLGIIITRLMTPEYKKFQKLQKELEDKKIELEQHKQDLTAHFSGAAEMMDTLGKNYTKLYQHMAKNSSELLPTLAIQDNPFLTNSVQSNAQKSGEANDAPPKDYVNGPTGALKTPPLEPVSPPSEPKLSDDEETPKQEK